MVQGNGSALWGESETEVADCGLGQLGFMRGRVAALVRHLHRVRKEWTKGCVVRCNAEERWLMAVRLVCQCHNRECGGDKGPSVFWDGKIHGPGVNERRDGLTCQHNHYPVM